MQGHPHVDCCNKLLTVIQYEMITRQMIHFDLEENAAKDYKMSSLQTGHHFALGHT